MVPEFHVEWAVFQQVLLSIALGAIVGLERQAQQTHEGRDQSGVRTFALVSLLGTTAALIYETSVGLAAVLGVGLLLLVVAHYVMDAHVRGRATGITTEISSLIVFALGALVPSRPLLSASIAVIATVLLSQKRIIHRSVERLTTDELYATIKLLLVSVVFLPLLPTEPVDPWGIYVPQDIWFLVVLISGISFVGYFAMRLFGARRGIAVTGVLGGLASSTALTLAMAARVRVDGARTERLAAFAIVTANTVMIVRVVIEVGTVSPNLLVSAALPLAGLFIASAIGAGGLWLAALQSETDTPPLAADDEPEDVAESEGADVEDEEADEPDEPDRREGTLDLDNPFQLGPALKFGAVFVLIIGLVHFAHQWFGDRGILVASVIGGLADADAMVLTASKMWSGGALDETSAVRAIVLAVASNSVVKAALGGFLGSRVLGLRVLLGLVPLALAAAAVFALGV